MFFKGVEKSWKKWKVGEKVLRESKILNNLCVVNILKMVIFIASRLRCYRKTHWNECQISVWKWSKKGPKTLKSSKIVKNGKNGHFSCFLRCAHFVAKKSMSRAIVQCCCTKLCLASFRGSQRGSKIAFCAHLCAPNLKSQVFTNGEKCWKICFVKNGQKMLNHLKGDVEKSVSLLFAQKPKN
jgi:hypothetical protein